MKSELEATIYYMGLAREIGQREKDGCSFEELIFVHSLIEGISKRTGRSIDRIFEDIKEIDEIKEGVKA